MQNESTVKDLRRYSATIERTKPNFIPPICTKCKSDLFLTDIIDNPDVDKDKIWFDEWTCSNKKCSCHQFVLLDWNW